MTKGGRRRGGLVTRSYEGKGRQRYLCLCSPYRQNKKARQKQPVNEIPFARRLFLPGLCMYFLLSFYFSLFPFNVRLVLIDQHHIANPSFFLSRFSFASSYIPVYCTRQRSRKDRTVPQNRKIAHPGMYGCIVCKRLISDIPYLVKSKIGFIFRIDKR